jgi:hypothetical protein
MNVITVVLVLPKEPSQNQINQIVTQYVNQEMRETTT